MKYIIIIMNIMNSTYNVELGNNPSPQTILVGPIDNMQHISQTHVKQIEVCVETQVNVISGYDLKCL